MRIRADADNKFNRRNLYIAIVGVLFAGWGAYDAFYAYPKKLPKAREYVRIVEAEPENWQQQWEQTAKERGWDRQPPKPPEEIQGDISFSILVFIVGLGITGFSLFKFWSVRGSWVEATESEIATSWGQRVPLDGLQRLNKQKWSNKGIARLYYRAEDGRARTLVLDDFKYDRESMGKILTLVESRLTPDQIEPRPSEPSEQDAEEPTEPAQPKSFGDSVNE